MAAAPIQAENPWLTIKNGRLISEQGDLTDLTDVLVLDFAISMLCLWKSTQQVLTLGDQGTFKDVCL